MVNISFHTVRQSRFIHRNLYEIENEDPKIPRGVPTWNAKPGFESLVKAFMRNKVLMRFNADTSSGTVRGTDEFKRIEDAIHAFCDTKCTGMWTILHRVSSNDYWDDTTHTMVRTGDCSGQMEIHFENEEDIPGFLKDCALVLKLTY